MLRRGVFGNSVLKAVAEVSVSCALRDCAVAFRELFDLFLARFWGALSQLVDVSPRFGFGNVWVEGLGEVVEQVAFGVVFADPDGFGADAVGRSFWESQSSVMGFPLRDSAQGRSAAQAVRRAPHCPLNSVMDRVTNEVGFAFSASPISPLFKSEMLFTAECGRDKNGLMRSRVESRFG